MQNGGKITYLALQYITNNLSSGWHWLIKQDNWGPVANTINNSTWGPLFHLVLIILIFSIPKYLLSFAVCQELRPEWLLFFKDTEIWTQWWSNWY
jgi:hypothetical protein